MPLKQRAMTDLFKNSCEFIVLLKSNNLGTENIFSEQICRLKQLPLFKKKEKTLWKTIFSDLPDVALVALKSPLKAILTAQLKMTSSKRQFLQQTASKSPIKESILIPHMTHSLNNGLVPSLCPDDVHSEPRGIFQKRGGHGWSEGRCAAM